jgi:AraC-like DNA-binding protein
MIFPMARAMTEGANRVTRRANVNASRAAAGASSTLEPSAPLVGAGAIRAFGDALERLGYDVDALLAGAGLRRRELEDPDAMVPCAAMSQLIGGAVAERRHSDLAAQLAHVTPVGAHPLLDYLVLTSDTVADALEQLVRYFHVTRSPVRCTLVHDGDVSRLVIDAGADTFAAQYDSALLVHHLRAETGQRVDFRCVSLTGVPDDRRSLERMLGCAVVAPSTWNGVELAHDMLSVPLLRRDAALRRVLERHAGSVQAHPESPGSIVDQVSTVIASRLRLGVPTLTVVARQLAMAPRTLQRRLGAEGTTFERLTDDVRRRTAERLLRDASLAVGEIGYLLGFSEPSAFQRAFRRHRLSPSAYRRSQTREPRLRRADGAKHDAGIEDGPRVTAR